MHPTQIQPDVTADATPAQTLRAAAVYLRRYGWITNDYYHHPHPANEDQTEAFPAACIAGATYVVIAGRVVPIGDIDDFHPDLDPHRQVSTALATLAEHLNLPDIEIPEDALHAVNDWNDTPGRSLDEVITALNQAADTWESTHGGVSTAGTTGGAR